MKPGDFFVSFLLGVIAFGLVPPTAAAEDSENFEKPDQVVTLQGEFVRMAYNDEGFVTLGYRTAQGSVDQEWMLLEIGLTLVDPTDDQRFKREQLSLQLPDGSTVGLATQETYNKENLRALDRRADTVRDSIYYFPRLADQMKCRLGFFAEADSEARTLARDELTLSRRRACLGRVYFHLPGGIKFGQYFLNVKFADSVVHVPFRIMTDEERKAFSKQWRDIKKNHDAGRKD